MEIKKEKLNLMQSEIYSVSHYVTANGSISSRSIVHRMRGNENENKIKVMGNKNKMKKA